jgi:hypothetical protein
VILLLRGSGHRTFRLTFTIVGTGALIAFGTVPYLRASRFIASPLSVLTAGLLALSVALPLIERALRPRWRTVLRAGAVVALFAAAAGVSKPGPYEGVTAYVRGRAYEAVGIESASAPVDRILSYGVTELLPYSLADVWSDKCLAASAAFLILGPVALLSYPRASARNGRGRWGLGLILFLTATFLGLTLFSRRNKILLGPLVAIVAGLSVDGPARHLAGKAGTRSGLAGIAAALLLCAAAAAAQTGLASRALATVALGIDPANLAAINWIRDETSPDVPILADWDEGYQIQTYARRPTLTDGFLESEANKARILETAAALFSPQEDDLRSLCGRYGVRFVLVEVTELPVYSRLLGREFSDYVIVGGGGQGGGQLEVTPLGRSVTGIRMFLSPGTLHGLRLRAAFGTYRIFEVG